MELVNIQCHISDNLLLHMESKYTKPLLNIMNPCCVSDVEFELRTTSSEIRDTVMTGCFCFEYRKLDNFLHTRFDTSRNLAPSMHICHTHDTTLKNRIKMQETRTFHIYNSSYKSLVFYSCVVYLSKLSPRE